MNVKDIKELHTKTVVELKKLLKDAEVELLSLKLDHKQAKLKNVRSISTRRREIAILKTILREKEGNKAISKVAASV